MKPRPRSRSQYSYSFFRLLAVIIFLQDITAQPIPYSRLSSAHLRAENQAQYPVFEHRPLPHGPPALAPVPHDSAQAVIVPEKTPKPVLSFFPYTVPIPWPTPFNGTHFAPIPKAIPVTLPASKPLSDDTYPMYIPVPQFEYVPFYYNPTKSSPPSPCPQVKVIKPVPKPNSVHKPVPKPTLEGRSTSSPTKISVYHPPTEAQPKPLVLYKDGKPLPKPTPFFRPPNHKWVPPPENIPEYIPPSPSILHPRSSVSHFEKNPSDYITYEPEYFTYYDDPPKGNYESKTNSYYDPESYSPYNPDHYKLTNDPYSRGQVDRTPYVTFGPDIVTYTEPSQYDTDDGYITFGPSIATFIEDSPVPPTPVQPPNKPTRPRPPNKVNPPKSPNRTDPPISPVRTNPPPPPYRSPSTPQHVRFGSTSSAFAAPEGPAQEEEQFVVFQPSIYTIVHDDEVPYKPSTPPQPPASGQQPATIGSGSSAFAASKQQKQEQEIGYADFGPEFVHITDDENGEKTVFYDPEVVTFTEDSFVPTSSVQPPNRTKPRPPNKVNPPKSPNRTNPPRFPTQTNPLPPPNSSPSTPQHVRTGSRSSAFAAPKGSAQEEEQFVFFEPSVYTIVDGDEVPYRPSPPPQPPAVSQPVKMGGRSPPFAGSEQPKQEQEFGYADFGPKFFHITDDENGEKTVFYDPEIVTIYEEEPHVVEIQPQGPNVGYVEESPGYYTFTDP